MAHAISASSYRSDHLSPSALALALLLHGLVGVALWWMMQHRAPSPMEEAIEVSFEQPKPPAPKPPEPKPEPQQKPPPPAPPEPLGLMPEAAITSEKRTQVPVAPVRPNEAPAPSAPAQADKPQPFAFSPSPSPPPVSKPVSPPEAVARPPAEPPTPTKPPEQPQTPFSTPLPAPALPTPTLPPAHALAPPLPAPPETHALAAPPLPRASPAPQRPDLHPAPPTTASTQRPAAPAHSEPRSTSPFVNPADTYNRARVADNYLWQVARKLQGYRYEAPHVNVSHGTTVVRVTIARDGRLLDVEVTRSSGIPEFDRGVLAGVRAGSPYDPLPPDIQGASASFNLPLVSVNRQ